MDQYLQYTAEDLAIDEHFVDWVLNPTTEKSKLWNDWIRQHPEMRTRITEAGHLVRSLSIRRLETAASASAIWQRLEGNLEAATPGKKHRWIQMLPWAAVAAAVILFVLLQTAGDSMISIETTPGLTTTYQLPDQSVITINDASKIEYDPKTFGKNRIIHLEGEAFFEVTSGFPFVVQTPKGSIAVLGTSFNVFAREDAWVVSCQSGRVSVQAGGQEAILTAGLEASLTRETELSVGKRDATGIPWIRGLYEYDSVPLSMVVSELERQFDVRIRLDGSLQDILYTGFFEDDDLDAALYSVFWPLKLTTEKNGRSISVHPED